MRSEAPPLLPIFRTRAQGEILALVLQDPDQEWTVSDLARATEVPLTTAQSEITRLESGALLSSRKVGRTRLVRANKANPATAPLAQVVLLTFGPRPVIADAFANLGAQRVIIFGSWAARLLGEPGPAPSDLDVLVVGDGISRTALYAAAESAQARLKRQVNPILRSTGAWAEPGKDPLIDEILRRPRVDVTNPPTRTSVAS
jgi:predicted nucleotidyltransferase